MQATQTPFDIVAIQSAWAAFDAKAHLRPIHDEAAYQRMVALLNSLLDVVGDDEDHALSGLLELLGDVVSTYEREHYHIEAAPPKDSQRFLMEARGLTQVDLGAIVPQGKLSAILSGETQNQCGFGGQIGQVPFFGVSPALFVPRESS